MKAEKEPPHSSVTKRPIIDYFVLLKWRPKVSDSVIVNCPTSLRPNAEAPFKPHMASTFNSVLFLSPNEYRSTEVGRSWRLRWSGAGSGVSEEALSIPKIGLKCDDICPP